MICPAEDKGKRGGGGGHMTPSVGEGGVCSMGATHLLFHLPQHCCSKFGIVGSQAEMKQRSIRLCIGRHPILLESIEQKHCLDMVALEGRERQRVCGRGGQDRAAVGWDGGVATYITHISAKTDQTSCQESSPAKWLTFSLHPINILLHTLLLNRCPWRRYLLKMGSACCT